MFLVLTREMLKGFDGVKVIPDVHGNLPMFIDAIDDATKKNLFILQLGDLVDRGKHPAACVEKMLELVAQGRGRFINGNHDWKFAEYALNGLYFNYDRRRTLLDFHATGRKEVLKQYVQAVKNGIYWARSPKCVMAHGGYHPEMTNDTIVRPHEVTVRAMRGIERGTDRWGLPIRVHDWIHEIPRDLTVFVGHDIVDLKQPVVKYGKLGGCAIFCDNGADMGNRLSHIDVTFQELGFGEE